MKQVLISLFCTLAFVTLKSDKILTDYDVAVADNSIVPKVGDPDDIDETPIAGIYARQVPVSVVICPGTGQRCFVVVDDGQQTIVYWAKKTPGGPDVAIY